MTLGPRAKLAHTVTAIASALLLLNQPAGAQTNEPAKTDGSLERAQKAADSVFHWIKLNAEKGANRQAQTPEPAQAPAPAPVVRKVAPPAPVAAAPRPAPAPVQAAVAPASEPESAPVPVMAQSEASAPVVAQPEPSPVLLASAPPTPAPTTPMAAAAKAVEPPPPPAEEEEAPLKLLSKVDPTIPRALLMQDFRSGYAQVQFTVLPDGKVSQVQVIKTSHHRLGNAAIDAVKQWRFAPIPKARDAAVELSFNTGEG